MKEYVLANSLYWLLLVTVVFLMLILLYNNLVLYRRKLRDPFSLMLLTSLFMCLFEALWTVTEGHPKLIMLDYFNACCYTMSFLAFATMLNYFFLNQFKMIPKNRWFRLLVYVLPNFIFFLVCVTTPWTGLLFWVDEAGNIHFGYLYQFFFNVLLLGYLIVALIAAVYYAAVNPGNNSVKRKISLSLIAFGVLVPLFYLIEVYFIKDQNEDYMSLSLACTVALVYLSSNVSTHLLMATQARIEAVEEDMRIAASIQTDALPPGEPEFSQFPNLSLRASMNPAKEVGGDFYDYFAIDDHRLCFLIADVSGKGMPAALFMMTAKTMIHDFALICDNTSEIFNRVNSRLCENNETGMFVTSLIAILDMQTMKLQYTNAGHNYPLIQHEDGSCDYIKEVHGLFLAGMDFTRYRQRELQMCPGDRLLFFTDGVTEAHDKNGMLYGEDRLAEVVKNTREESGEGVIAYILDDINSFARNEAQFDDITMLVLTIK